MHNAGSHCTVNTVLTAIFPSLWHAPKVYQNSLEMTALQIEKNNRFFFSLMIQFNFNAKTIILAETLQPLYHKLATSYNLGKKEKKRELGKTRFRWKSSESIHPSLEWTQILLYHWPSNTIMRSWSKEDTEKWSIVNILWWQFQFFQLFSTFCGQKFFFYKRVIM